MTKFIRIMPKALGGSLMLDGVTFRFSKGSGNQKDKSYLALFFGVDVREKLGMEKGGKIFIGYSQDNSYQLEVMPAERTDNAYKLCSTGGKALSIKFPWPLAKPPEEAFAYASKTKYELKDDSVIIDLVFANRDI